MEFENLIYEVSDGVARITLNREKAANALDVALARELMYAATEAVWTMAPRSPSSPG